MEKIAGLTRQDTAVGWYRIINPIIFIGKTGVKYATNRFSGQNEVATFSQKDSGPFLEDGTLMKIAKGADVIWTTMIYDFDEILKILDLRRWSGAKWVVDIDDDLYNVSSDNPARKNVDALKHNMETCLKLADGITVSVPLLVDTYKHLNPNIYVNYNGQSVEDWDKLRTKYKNKKIRIGWRGASGHNADVALVRPALEELKKKYDIEFVTLGVEPPFKTEHHGWVSTMDFPKTLASLKLDIGLVPLIDKPYNRCKSNIAVQEFSMLKIPVVASPVENQKDMPVLYASTNYDWYEQIEKLILDEKLRRSQREKAYHFVSKKYDMKKLTKPLIKWMDNLLRKDI